MARLVLDLLFIFAAATGGVAAELADDFNIPEGWRMKVRACVAARHTKDTAPVTDLSKIEDRVSTAGVILLYDTTNSGVGSIFLPIAFRKRRHRVVLCQPRWHLHNRLSQLCRLLLDIARGVPWYLTRRLLSVGSWSAVRRMIALSGSALAYFLALDVMPSLLLSMLNELPAAVGS